jgi:hypothetical protein
MEDGTTGFDRDAALQEGLPQCWIERSFGRPVAAEVAAGGGKLMI